jgi:hypothetical protein
MRSKNPRDIVTVFVPEYVVGRWWEQVLHNQSALRIKARLLFQPGVMVVSVPWQLKSAERVRTRAEPIAGAYRRGIPSALVDDRPAAPSPASARARAEADGRGTDGRGTDGRGTGGRGTDGRGTRGTRTDGTRAGAGRPRT